VVIIRKKNNGRQRKQGAIELLLAFLGGAYAHSQPYLVSLTKDDNKGFDPYVAYAWTDWSHYKDIAKKCLVFVIK